MVVCMLLSEALLLLLLDDEKGSPVHAGFAHDEGLAGALLLDLLDAGALSETDGKLVAAGAPPSAPAPSAAWSALAEPRDAKKAIAAVVKAAKPVKATIAAPLVEAGVLDETRHKRLGLFETTRYPQRDHSPEQTLRSELRAVLVSGQTPTAFIASLLGLLVPMDLVGRLVERDERRAAKARAKQVAEHGPVGDAVKAAVQQQIAAVVAATATSAAASTST
jgi:Golgi phosphoprotein 3 GPP34